MKDIGGQHTGTFSPVQYVKGLWTVSGTGGTCQVKRSRASPRQLRPAPSSPECNAGMPCASLPHQELHRKVASSCKYLPSGLEFDVSSTCEVGCCKYLPVSVSDHTL